MLRREGTVAIAAGSQPIGEAELELADVGVRRVVVGLRRPELLGDRERGAVGGDGAAVIAGLRELLGEAPVQEP